MYKQLIILRTDLKMDKGKMVAQGAHASLSAYLKTKNLDKKIISDWEKFGQKKVVLKVNGEKEILEQFEMAKEQRIPAVLIRDAGLTQIEAGSITALGIGPWNENELDNLYGKLKLL